LPVLESTRERLAGFFVTHPRHLADTPRHRTYEYSEKSALSRPDHGKEPKLVTEPSGERRLGRSIFAIATGIIVGVALTLITDTVLHKIGFYSPLGQTTADKPLAVATVYRVVFSVLGAYIIARLAPNRPMFHSLISGVIGLMVSIVGALATWNHVPPLGPHWYPVALVVTALPCAWLGAKLYLTQSTGEQPPSV
jgi:hypothetical protein